MRCLDRRARACHLGYQKGKIFRSRIIAGCTHFDFVDDPKRKFVFVAFNEVMQVPRMHLKFLECCAVEVVEGLERDFGPHCDKN